MYAIRSYYEGAEATRHAPEKLGYEVIAFHANGTGGMAMEELAAEGYVITSYSIHYTKLYDRPG